MKEKFKQDRLDFPDMCCSGHTSRWGREMEAFICPIVKQFWLLSFMQCKYCFGISQTQQLMPWADTNLHLLLKRSRDGGIEQYSSLSLSLAIFISFKHLLPTFNYCNWATGQILLGLSCLVVKRDYLWQMCSNDVELIILFFSCKHITPKRVLPSFYYQHFQHRR